MGAQYVSNGGPSLGSPAGFLLEVVKRGIYDLS